MERYLQSIFNVVVDRSAESLIGAVLIALVLALVVAGVYALLHRKVSDPTVLLTCLVMAANVAAMMVAGGYVRTASMRMGRPGVRSIGVEPRFPPGGFGGGPGRGPGMASRILDGADSDGDGRLSAAEASEGVDRFMREAGHGEPLDEEALREAIRERLAGPPGPPIPDEHRPGGGERDRRGGRDEQSSSPDARTGASDDERSRERERAG
jgi:hypothetical protein